VKANVSEANVKRLPNGASGRSWKNFLETRVIEYQTGGALGWD
jgi:hypothetical protein